MSKRTTTNWGVILVLVIGTIGILAGAYAVGGSLLGARYIGGGTDSRLMTPLIRSIQASRSHCYGNGTGFCKRFLDAEKEFTLAYLFYSKPRGISSEQLWGCVPSRRQAGTQPYLVTKNRRDCSSKRMRPYRLGYLATEPKLEASVKLLRCYSQGDNNYLVTDDERECETSGHNDEVIELGYAAEGPLTIRRHDQLCAALSEVPGQEVSAAVDAYCRQSSGFDDTANVNQGDLLDALASLSNVANAMYKQAGGVQALSRCMLAPSQGACAGDKVVSDLIKKHRASLPANGSSLAASANYGGWCIAHPKPGGGDYCIGTPGVGTDDVLHFGRGESGESYTCNKNVLCTRTDVSYPWPWQNPENRFDVNDDGKVAPNDGLAISNMLRRSGRSGRIQLSNPPREGDEPPPYADITGDGFVSEHDLNAFNAHVNGG